MEINRQLSPEETKITILKRMLDSLQNISSNISYEMGPLKVQKVSTIAEEMKPEWDRQAEANRREEEIDELKKSNKIAERTAKLAVYGLIASVIVGAAGFLIQLLQLRLDNLRYQEEKEARLIEAHIVPDNQFLEATSSTQFEQATSSSQSTQN